MPQTTRATVAEVVIALLIDEGVCHDPDDGDFPADWSAFTPNEPGSPDRCVTVRGTDSGRSDRVMTGELTGPSSIQVRVRGATEGEAHRKIDEIQTLFATGVYRREVTVTLDDGTEVDYLISSFVRIGDVIPLGRERPTGDRYLCTLNAMINFRET